jgi:acetolactate synthase I/II/III large subunit
MDLPFLVLSFEPQASQHLQCGRLPADLDRPPRLTAMNALPTATPLTTPRLAGHVLVDQLRCHGADLAFGVPGESYLAVLDGFHAAPDLRFIICRHEGGAAVMAEAYGKLTGRPGLCFVTRGPGATNASIGVHTAFQDSTPMILFIGQVGSDFRDREAFQEVDYRQMFHPLAKWVEQIDRADRIPEYIRRAYQIATSGRPGPVVLALPEDMLIETVTVADAPPYERLPIYPGERDLALLAERLAAAQSPVLILGGSGWTQAAREHIEQFAQTWQLPVTCAFRFQDRFDSRHPNYAGDVGIGINPALAKRIRAADLVIALGPRLGEMTTSGYQLLTVPKPAQALVHILAGADELGRVYAAELAINATIPEAAAALAALKPKAAIDRRVAVEAAHSDYLANVAPVKSPGTLNLSEVMRFLSERLPEDAILTNGAGNYASWLHRFYRYRGLHTQLAPTSGAMGYGAPAAVAGKIVHPERIVVCMAGDGCFLMNGQELATAVQYDAAVIFIVVNNGMYGTIRMHQEREYPARISGTELKNPDFAALAQAFGAYGEVVLSTAEFAPAFERALASQRPALLELRIDPEAITPRATLTELRTAAQQALAAAKGSA